MKKAFRPSGAPPGSLADMLACKARAFVLSGHDDAARAAYDELVGVLQRRASRIAFHYLRDGGEADEAVQDAFVKAYVHLASYNEALPFDAWFVRILVNGCLDRLKKRRRRLRWSAAGEIAARASSEPTSPEPSIEAEIVARERYRSLGEAINRLPSRQRTVVLLTHLDGRTPREVSAMTGMSESTVRVHLFRALRRLRSWLEATPRGDACEKEA